MKNKLPKEKNMNKQKIFVLHKGDGPNNGVGQYIGEPIGFTYEWDFAVKWAKDNKGYYNPLELINE